MQKLKSTFLRTKDVEERRSQQFVKRHSNLTQPPLADEEPCGPPSINLSELSEREQKAYRSWWKDLDPFGLGKLENKTALVFLGDCGLPDKKLEEILQLFQDAVGGLSEIEFYAMLRLIAHAQNGRQITRDLIFLGAPVPRFNTNPIDALIKPAVSRRTTPPPEPSHSLNSNTEKPSWATSTRKSWWGQQLSAPNPSNGAFQTQESFRSPPIWSPPAPASAPAPPPLHVIYSPPQDPSGYLVWKNQPQQLQQPQPQPQQSHQLQQPQQQPQQPQQPHQPQHHHQQQSHQSYSVTQVPSMSSQPAKPNIERTTYTHSRSRSVPFSAPSLEFPPELPSINPLNDPPTAKPPLLTSHSAMDSSSFERFHPTGIDTGQSLLLTKKFVYKPKSTNPFDNEYDEPNAKTTPRSPFDDNGALTGSASTSSLSSNASSITTRHLNNHPNQQNIPPPPVPAQTTKPAFPRYARNSQPSALKRSQSHGAKTVPSQTMYDTMSVGTALFNDTRLSRHKSMGSYITNR